MARLIIIKKETGTILIPIFTTFVVKHVRIVIKEVYVKYEMTEEIIEKIRLFCFLPCFFPLYNKCGYLMASLSQEARWSFALFLGL